MPPDDDLPYLTFAAARHVGTFPAYSYAVTPSEIALYQEVTNDRNPLYVVVMPPGVAGIFGRTSYLQAHRMPPGGVLLGQDITWHHPATLSEPLTIQARLVDSSDVDGKLSLTFETTAHQQEVHVCTVVLRARWPR